MISSPRTIPNHTFLSNDCSYDVNKALYLFKRHRLCEKSDPQKQRNRNRIEYVQGTTQCFNNVTAPKNTPAQSG